MPHTHRKLPKGITKRHKYCVICNGIINHSFILHHPDEGCNCCYCCNCYVSLFNSKIPPFTCSKCKMKANINDLHPVTLYNREISDKCKQLFKDDLHGSVRNLNQILNCHEHPYLARGHTKEIFTEVYNDIMNDDHYWKSLPTTPPEQFHASTQQIIMSKKVDGLPTHARTNVDIINLVDSNEELMDEQSDDLNKKLPAKPSVDKTSPSQETKDSKIKSNQPPDSWITSNTKVFEQETESEDNDENDDNT